MKFNKNSVYTVIRNAVVSLNGDAFVSGTYVPVSPKFPAVMAQRIGFTQIPSSTSLLHNDCGYRDTWECQIYSNKKVGSAEEAYAIFDTINSAMQGINFILDSCGQMNNVDASVYRLVARWHRVTGSGDEMPK